MSVSTHDVAISAVSFDSLYVAELAAALAPRLRTKILLMDPIDDPALDGPKVSAPVAGLSEARLVVVLYQRLWGRIDPTRAHVETLRERIRTAPDSVLVVAVDGTPIPAWLSAAPGFEASVSGPDTVVDAVVHRLAELGVATRTPRTVKDDSAPEVATWSGGGAPFLASARATTSLRRELEVLSVVLSRELGIAGRGLSRSQKLFVTPERIVAQLGSIGLSFSWLATPGAPVGKGRLMVVQWDGVVSHAPGMGALRTARAVHECVYCPEATAQTEWRWRATAPSGGVYRSSTLVEQWLATVQLDQPADVVPPVAMPLEVAELSA